MNVYCAYVDCWYKTSPRAKPRRQQQVILLECDSIFELGKQAEKIAEANACFGPRLLGVEFRRGHRVTFPAGLKLERR